jgi:putative membrane protein
MNSALLIAGSVLVGIAAVIHVLIFVLESILWSRPSTWRRFGLRSQGDADIVKPMAFNQGFYNLFLGVGVKLGLLFLWAWGSPEVGLALVFLGAGSMVAAAAVLILSSPKLARAAALQGVAPLVGIILLVLALTTS